jgi:hypothetical protein
VRISIYVVRVTLRGRTDEGFTTVVRDYAAIAECSEDAVRKVRAMVEIHGPAKPGSVDVTWEALGDHGDIVQMEARS